MVRGWSIEGAATATCGMRESRRLHTLTRSHAVACQGRLAFANGTGGRVCVCVCVVFANGVRAVSAGGGDTASA